MLYILIIPQNLVSLFRKAFVEIRIPMRIKIFVLNFITKTPFYIMEIPTTFDLDQRTP